MIGEVAGSSASATGDDVDSVETPGCSAEAGGEAGELLQLLHFALGAPAPVARAGLLQVGVAEQRVAARAPEPGGHFVGDGLVMHEAALARRGQRRLVQALRVRDAPLDAGDLGVGQRRPAAKVIGALPGPRAEPAGVRDQGVPVPRAILGRDLVVAPGVGQRGVEVVLGGLEELGRRPEERRRILGGRHGGGEVVAWKRACSFRIQYQQAVIAMRGSRRRASNVSSSSVGVRERAEPGQQAPEHANELPVRPDGVGHELEARLRVGVAPRRPPAAFRRAERPARGAA